MRRISCVCGSLAIANWTSSRFALRMLALRALGPIRNTLEQGSTAIHIGSRSISRQAGILPGFCSCTPMLRAPLRGMPRPCDCSRGSVSVWNQRVLICADSECKLVNSLRIRAVHIKELLQGTKLSFLIKMSWHPHSIAW